MRTANGAHMKMLCEGDINVDVITKSGDVTSDTLRVKVTSGMKQKLFSVTQAMMGGWTMHGGQTKQGELFIALTHEDHKPIIFDRVLKAGNSVLLAVKMVIKNPEEDNATIVNGNQSKEYFHRVARHAGHHLIDATAKYYKVDLAGKVNNCRSCSLEKIRQKNISKKNEGKTMNPGDQVTKKSAMSMIDDNSATPRDPSSVRAWMELSKYGEYEKSRNMINVPLARQKSTLEHRSNKVLCTVENVARAQPSVSHEEDEIQNFNFDHVPSKRPSDDPEDDDRKPAAERI